MRPGEPRRGGGGGGVDLHGRLRGGGGDDDRHGQKIHHRDVRGWDKQRQVRWQQQQERMQWKV